MALRFYADAARRSTKQFLSRCEEAVRSYSPEAAGGLVADASTHAHIDGCVSAAF